MICIVGMYGVGLARRKCTCRGGKALYGCLPARGINFAAILYDPFSSGRGEGLGDGRAAAGCGSAVETLSDDATAAGAEAVG